MGVVEELGRSFTLIRQLLMVLIRSLFGDRDREDVGKLVLNHCFLVVANDFE